ncbi:NAD-dependent dihydropyrimidine dehydrogenase subunit PreA [Scatolibacter rhodanostii]|uniref:NAD-dependent dihydropyrimidine dehydrogenase subunit PreA n=1 Tax=Scatolibacter rhodanostii TaxID=2014781 RepID=UPI001FA8A1DF|nr:NAD-dependent dihydropyrimidine dehydrogenase subunit PreA [Scatolibacter rhodanostii]
MKSTAYQELIIPQESAGCFLCENAPCTKACPYGLAVDSVIRSARFENTKGAAAKLPQELSCLTCETQECLSSCLKGKIGNPVDIPNLLEAISMNEAPVLTDIDLSIDFCGVSCENPFFLSSSVVGSNYEMVAKAFDMGWSGVAFKTIGAFVPDEVSPRFDAMHKESVPFVGFKNIEQISDSSLHDNLGYLKKLKQNYPAKIIVASIMGRNLGEWEMLARAVTEAGADIIECNFSCPHMAEDGLGSDVGQNPELVAEYTAAVRKGTSLPILAKMTPNIGNMEIPAMAAVKAGADGIAAINTIKSIMNVNLSSFSSGPDVNGVTSVGGYSGKAVKPIALRFIQNLKACEPIANVPVSGMGGIETWRDAAEFIAMGCENIQITTSVMQYGYRIIDDLIEGMKIYLAESGFSSVGELVGKALPQIVSTEKLERDSICYPRFNRTACVGCGRCVLSCYDGGHQALTQNDNDGKPVMNASKCVGCHLCAVVCPVKAILPGTRVKKKRNEAAS